MHRYVSGFFSAAPLSPPATAAEVSEALGTPGERARLAYRQPMATADDRMVDLRAKRDKFLAKSPRELEDHPSAAKYKIHSQPYAQVDYVSGYRVAALMVVAIRRLICFYSSLGYSASEKPLAELDEQAYLGILEMVTATRRHITDLVEAEASSNEADRLESLFDANMLHLHEAEEHWKSKDELYSTGGGKKGKKGGTATSSTVAVPETLPLRSTVVPAAGPGRPWNQRSTSPLK